MIEDNPYFIPAGGSPPATPNSGGWSLSERSSTSPWIAIAAFAIIWACCIRVMNVDRSRLEGISPAIVTTVVVMRSRMASCKATLSGFGEWYLKVFLISSVVILTS